MRLSFELWKSLSLAPNMKTKKSAEITELDPPLQYAEPQPQPADLEFEDDDIAWATRSGMWQSRVAKASARRTKRAKAQPALILAGHGVSLRVEGDALTIQNGFMHYRQQREIIRYFRGDVALPERIILLDGSRSISFDVLSWLSEQKVSFIRIGKATLSASLAHRDIQPILFACGGNGKPAKILSREMNFAGRQLRGKSKRQLSRSKNQFPGLTNGEQAMKSAYAALSRLEENPPGSISELRVLEANCAASYFCSWVGIPIKWRGTSRRPIPENWYFVGQRSSPYHLAGNRNAAHPVNAMLNYAYAALESEIRIKAISDGYDPTIGIMHDGSDGSSKFIFDLMEPQRPKVDRAVLDFVKGTVFDPADFTIRNDGVVRLNPQLARHVANLTTRALSFN
jgi:CRISPR-associated protein Cas1